MSCVAAVPGVFLFFYFYLILIGPHGCYISVGCSKDNTMTHTTQNIKDRCVEHAKTQIKRLKDGDQINPLDITYQVKPSGNITEVTLTTATGGPHIEIELANQAVTVTWGSDSTRRAIMDDQAQDRCEQLLRWHTELADF